jgi:hypothetical protein
MLFTAVTCAKISCLIFSTISSLFEVIIPHFKNGEKNSKECLELESEKENSQDGD